MITGSSADTAITGALFALAFIRVNAFSYLSGYREDCGFFGQVPLLHWQVLVLDIAMLIMALSQLAPRHIHKDRDILHYYKQPRRWLVPVSGIVILVALLSVSTFIVTASPTVTTTPAPEPIKPTPSPEAETLTPTSPSPTEPPECITDRLAIQAALDAYHAARGIWPTIDGQPGLIIWAKLVPDFMNKEPLTTSCKWRVNSDPLGQVCRSTNC